MKLDCEQAKRIDLVAFLTRRYGCIFRQHRRSWSCCSPLTGEQTASFHVRLATDGHWLFKDFSSGASGTILDVVQIKEKLPSIAAVLQWLSGQCPELSSAAADSPPPPAGASSPRGAPTGLYRALLRNNIEPSVGYLCDRGISPVLVAELAKAGDLLHNRFRGKSYCCVAVRDMGGRLGCLDNRRIDGAGRFVVGRKTAFTRDWPALARAHRVFICEGIIDYLSVKTLGGAMSLPGLALLGKEPTVIPVQALHCCRELVMAVDDDHGGRQAWSAVSHRFPHCRLTRYDLAGCRDPNDLLMNLTPYPYSHRPSSPCSAT